MSLADIVADAAAEGVKIAVSDAGELKVTGKAEAVNRGLPTVREHKPAIIRALNDAIVPLTADEESEIRRWLAHIGEVDADLIEYCIGECRADLDKRKYFLARSEEAPAIVVEVEHVTPSCMTCVHRRGRHDLRFGCVAREDLAPLYGPNHPLRALPDDGGVGCGKFYPSLARRDRVWH